MADVTVKSKAGERSTVGANVQTGGGNVHSGAGSTMGVTSRGSSSSTFGGIRQAAAAAAAKNAAAGSVDDFYSQMLSNEYGNQTAYDAGSDWSSSAFDEQQAAAERARAEAEAKARAERERNERLRRESEAKRRADELKAQQDRQQKAAVESSAKAPITSSVESERDRKRREKNARRQELRETSTQVSDADMLASIDDFIASRAEEKAQKEAQAAERAQERNQLKSILEAMTADEVEAANEGRRPASASENLGYVDPTTGEIVNTTPERAPESMMARAMSAAMDDDIEAAALRDMEAGRTGAGRPGSIPMTEADRYDAAAEYLRDMEAERTGAGNPDSILMTEADRYDAAAEALRDMEAGRSGAGRVAERTNDRRYDARDAVYRGGYDITGVKGERAQLKKLQEIEGSRHEVAYSLLKESSDASADANFDMQDFGPVEFDPDADLNKSESLLRRKLMAARNIMLRRFLNPTLLHVEGEYVETEKRNVNGQERTYGVIRYSNRVEGMIGNVRRLYDCSIYNVMQLVQLRAGLGVDKNGKIAKVDPNEFRLTEDQFVELCRDIVESQNTYGHPLGVVQGKPGGSGVRDDSGKYVVVAKTRCFPLGYMPKQLIRDLRSNWNSQLHQMSEDQIQRMVNERWINETYPTLCANTGGNLMYQARAIENMMRGLATMDGVDASYLKIPAITERQTLMMLRAEAQATTDADIESAREIRARADEAELSRMMHRYKKESGSRITRGGNAGEIQSAAYKNRIGRVNRAFTTITNLQRAGRAAKTMILISGMAESAYAEAQMSVSNMLSDAWFSSKHGKEAVEYGYTGQLESLASTKEAVEARSVAESLYRIGGLDMLRVFFSETDDAGRAKNRLTRANLRQFLRDWGVIGEAPTMSERLREKLNVKPGQERSWMLNAQNVMEMMDDLMLGSSNMFKERESKQFVKMSMAEMGRAAVNGREAYTSAQVENWGVTGSGEEMVRSLLQTDAGVEAFMTQGITSLGRKSPVQNAMRAVLAGHGVTQFAVRNFFNMFIEYGINKAIRNIPMSNTISFLTSKGVSKVGDVLAAGSDSIPLGGVPNIAGAMQRTMDYQVGSRMSFREGLIKNVRYDMVMAGSEIGKALVVYGIVKFLGGLYPPPDDEEENRYSFSEWLIGQGEDAAPIKFAWWMDDLAGTGLPLGLSLAILDQGDWSSESMRTAVACFLNQMSNFNDGTSVADAVDLINNPADFIEEFLGSNVEGLNPEHGQAATAFMRQKLWDILGDMTPAFIGEIIPWSRDYLFRGDADQTTPYKKYDENGRVVDVTSYDEVMRRVGAQRNWMQALFYDLTKDKSDTSYKYAEMPTDTMTDPLALKLYSDFYLDTSKLPIDQDERIGYLNSSAEAVIQYIDENYQNVDQAITHAFALNYEQKRNCMRYCYDMIDAEEAAFEAEKAGGYLPYDEYQAMKQRHDDVKSHYYDLINDYFSNSSRVPSSVPKYAKQETDLETRYVDSEGHAAVNPILAGIANPLLEALGMEALEPGEKESYRYGNIPSVLPWSSPRDNERTGYNYETIPYWIRLDENGNPIGDVGEMFDLAGQLGTTTMGYYKGKDLQETMWGGQGNNLYDDVSERLEIPREGVATLGRRALRLMEDTVPEALKNMSDEELFGIKQDKKSTPTTSTSSSGGSYYPRYYGYSRSYGGYGRSYGGYGGGSYGSYGSSYSGGSSYTSPYNPKIYSNPRNVYGTRAAGLSTKAPYKATTTYLRPNFYTKGSREAYKRSDI